MNLHIPSETWQKLQLYAELSLPNEVTGIGTIQVLGREDLLVTETFLPRQKTSPAVCEFADGELNEIMYSLIERNPERGASELRFRWHSHGQGRVFWSGKDEQDIESWESPWVVNLVINTRGEHLLRLDCFNPLRISNHPVNLCIDYPGDFALRIACQEELQQRLMVVPPPAIGQFFGKEPMKNGLLRSTQDL